jgi:hypothetical protein
LNAFDVRAQVCTAVEKLRIVTLWVGFGTARQKMALERWTNPKPQRRARSPRYKVPSYQKGNRRASRNGRMSDPPPEIPTVTIRDFGLGVGGKKRAEDAVLKLFPTGGAVLRPGFIFGDRVVAALGVTVPLGVVAEPIQKLLALNPFQVRRGSRSAGQAQRTAIKQSCES